MESAEGRKIKITKDGPYLVSGDVPLTRETILPDAEGESESWRVDSQVECGSRYALCRCGKSKTKPFCDGAHVREGFDGTEEADRRPTAERQVLIEGPLVDLADDAVLCAEARFCHRAGKAWRRVLEDDPDSAEIVVLESALCPSGRYTAIDKASGAPIEPDLETSIAVVNDPQMGVAGPLWVRNGIAIESADGHVYEVRNRVTLCRCGQSKNKPFCDGTHCLCDFHDD
ncbi:MAG: CDGSH iron-sulfur domain-containing protein [Coriobacteriia bacterium]